MQQSVNSQAVIGADRSEDYSSTMDLVREKDWKVDGLENANCNRRTARNRVRGCVFGAKEQTFLPHH
ncbi:hypothetical protein GCM10007094_32570 [Pseudovibrio japonicus]|uniref:Transposase n=1 Tax=Pseudovibrio japonicus TaxID=366534 RepID=A0ABQ3EIE7_9HYPH|nr:hypothetical protein GCM10007094_32570 [Pseudovibrio japonicus]